MDNIVELQTDDRTMSKSENLKYSGVTVFNDVTRKPCDGEYNIDGTIIRFKDGLLHGGKTPDGLDVPAYETETGHTEFFENGLLHRDGYPAVISDWGNWEEWWSHGNLIFIRARGSIKSELVSAGAKG